MKKERKRILTVLLASALCCGAFVGLNTTVNAAEDKTVYAYQTLSVQTTKLDASETKLSSDSVYVGEGLTVYAKATGGTAPYKYKYTYRIKNGEWVTASDYSSISSYSLKLSDHIGEYTVRVCIKDSENNYTSKYLNVVVKQKTGQLFENSNSSVSSNTAYIGNTITATADFKGGTAPYKYKYSYRNGSGEWVSVGGYTTDTNKKITVPNTPGFYTVRIGALDADNHYTSKYINITVKQKTGQTLANNGSSLNTGTVNVGGTVTAAAKFKGGTAPYKYKYSYRRNGSSEWVSVGGYTTDTNKKITVPNTSGFYTVRIGVLDADNNYTSKYVDLTVKKSMGTALSANDSNSNATSAVEGSTITFNAKFTGGSMPYKYKYSYRTGSGSWQELTDYTTSSSYNLKFANAGEYTFRVAGIDADGKYVSKYIGINIYSKTSTKVINTSYIQASAKWASWSYEKVPSGAQVNIITKSGNWFKVKYNNRIGWLYNLSLGNYKNYSTVNTSTLPTIADDIIFSKGKSIPAFYSYSMSMSYTGSARSDTLENLCVYALKYRRGACYHRAAILYYLLDRAGFEAVRINDGIDMYTGGGPHNWCMVKVSGKWRHIDSTPVIGLPRFYLVTDNAIAPYFKWDRNKYPKAE